MAGLTETWWNTISSFLFAAPAVFRGEIGLLPLASVIATVCFLAGVILLVAWRVQRGARALWLVVAAMLAPVAISLADAILGGLGMVFAILAGAIFLLVGTALFAHEADRRVPVWLIGIAAMLLAAHCANASGAFDFLG